MNMFFWRQKNKVRSELKDFFAKQQNQTEIQFERRDFDIQWLINKSELPWYELDLKDFPYKQALKEAKRLKKYFLPYRAGDGGDKSNHCGWKSLVLHGLSNEHAEHWANYGLDYQDETEVPYKWTEFADACPSITNYFKERFPHEEYHRVRIMMVEPGGYIFPHRDRDFHMLNPINIALNNPLGCKFVMDGHGAIPFRDRSAFLLDIGNTHAVWNNSPKARYHIIVHGHYGKRWHIFEKMMRDSYAKYCQRIGSDSNQ